MGSFVACCTVLFTLFTFNIDGSFINQAIENPLSFFKSLFFANNLPVKTRDTKSYTVALVGDSMTQVRGSAEGLREALKNYYPDKEFGILNFGMGSTSILSVPERLKSESKRGAETLPAILDTRPDIIILESFGNNPLSQFNLDEGLKKQTETLDKILKIIKENRPDTVLVFEATIAPSKERYAEGAVNLLPEQRKQWADERIAYIKNHINYAKSHNIPLVNVYEKSLNDKGDGHIEYLNGSDFIHPSQTGVQLINQKTADLIFEKEIIPRL